MDRILCLISSSVGKETSPVIGDSLFTSSEPTTLPIVLAFKTTPSKTEGNSNTGSPTLVTVFVVAFESSVEAILYVICNVVFDGLTPNLSDDSKFVGSKDSSLI